ncbi:hypothetical protein, partial [Spirosoma arboris]|uniref:hypothetical protein n=1 Tax=Spirosoma arboris TaxID=2682092 RepID=UPI001D119A47
MVIFQGGGLHTGQQPQGILLIATIVDLVAGNVGITAGTRPSQPVESVGETALITEALRAQIGTVQRVHTQPGG